jgi:hypothetical protein
LTFLADNFANKDCVIFSEAFDLELQIDKNGFMTKITTGIYLPLPRGKLENQLIEFWSFHK